MDYVENNLDFARELQKQFAQLSVEVSLSWCLQS